MKHKIEHVEFMIINSCQLSCSACATFSDLKHSGYATWEEDKKDLVVWLQRLEPECVGLMGGEPFMNPDILNWITGLRKLLPNSQIRVPTNGLLLEKKLDIVDKMHDLGNCVLKISYHTDSQGLRKTIKQILNRYDFKPVTEFGINRWSTQNNFKFQINSPSTFLKSFLNDYKNMLPHDNNPAESFNICVAQRCAFLYKNKLFKCSTAGLTPDIHQRFGSPNLEKWKPFLNTGLSHDCSEEELSKFVKNFGKPNKICAQCPTNKDTESLIDHRATVAFK